MTGWLRRVIERIAGPSVPEGFTGSLDATEHVLAVAEARTGGHLVASSFGLWLPDGRRIGWHVLSKASWSSGWLTLVEAEEVGRAGEAVLLRDRRPLRFGLIAPGALPDTVHRRVTGSIRSSQHQDLPGGGAWFVQRRVPGRDGVVLQVRADDGTDAGAVERVAAEVAAKLRAARDAARR